MRLPWRGWRFLTRRREIRADIRTDVREITRDRRSRELKAREAALEEQRQALAARRRAARRH